MKTFIYTEFLYINKKDFLYIHITKYSKMPEILPNNLAILGYSGGVLAEQFETLTALSFAGGITIVRNESVKRCDVPFQTHLAYEEIMCEQIVKSSFSGYLFGSTKPGTKQFLFQFYNELWSLCTEHYVNLIHPLAVMASTVKKGQGLFVEPLSRVGAYSQIGFGVNIHSLSSLGHHNVIGDFSTIQPGCTLAGLVVVGSGTTIGPGTTVFYGVKIGKNCVIGGGSTVIHDIPDNCLAYGSPCRVVRKNVE